MCQIQEFKDILKNLKIPLAIFEKMVYTKAVNAGVLELVDEVDSKSTGGNTVPVRARPPAPKKQRKYVLPLLFFVFEFVMHYG